MGSLHFVCFVAEVLFGYQSVKIGHLCVPLSQSVKRNITFAATPLVLTPFVRNRRRRCSAPSARAERPHACAFRGFQGYGLSITFEADPLFVEWLRLCCVWLFGDSSNRRVSKRYPPSNSTLGIPQRFSAQVIIRYTHADRSFKQLF